MQEGQSAETGSVAVAPIIVRPYTDADEEAALGVMVSSLGGGPGGQRSAEFFRWKHYDNPFGRSFILVAEAEHRIVGVRALMRWRFEADGRPVNAVRAVDTATHPQWQGRGLFTRLTLDAIEYLRDEADLIFNTPNHKSLPGYLKMGWHVVEKVPISVRVRRPIHFSRRVRTWKDSAPPSTSRPPIQAVSASEALRLDGIDTLLNARSMHRELETSRDIAYLRWRYGAAPLLEYRAVVYRDGNAIVGVAIFRVRPRGALWESTVSEVITARGDMTTCARLLRAVVRAAPVDHVTCHFPPRSVQASAARRLGFFPSPGGMTFVVNPLRDALPMDPQDARSWALSLGDLEVF